MKFGQSMGIYDPKVDLEGHRSKVKVTRLKNTISGSFYSLAGTLFIGLTGTLFTPMFIWVEDKGHWA